ncbi:MAG: helix-turn-helix domain-containing protein [Pseudomonadota bacterium]
MGSTPESLLDGLLGASVVQGTVLAAIAWRRRGAAPALRWFALVMATLALLSLLDLLWDGPHAALVASIALQWTSWIPAPAFWLYLRTLIGLPTRPRSRLLRHFLPALAMALPSAWLAWRVHLDGRAALDVPVVARAWATWNTVLAAGFVLGLVAYLGLAAYWLRRHAAALRDAVADTGAHELAWLRQLLALALAIGLASAIGIFGGKPWAVTLAVLVQSLAMLYIGVRALQQPGILGLAWLEQVVHDAREPAGGAAAPAPDPPVFDGAAADAAAGAARPSYARSGLDAPRAAALATALRDLMDGEKPFLEDDLTLPGLAARLGASPHALSQVLNQQLGTTFHDFIAAHRVADVQRCLRDPAYDGQAILDLAFAAGFRSKSAFHEAFRRATRTTPSRYRATRGNAGG